MDLHFLKNLYDNPSFFFLVYFHFYDFYYRDRKFKPKLHKNTGKFVTSFIVKVIYIVHKRYFVNKTC